MTQDQTARRRTGWLMFVALAALTAAEFGVSAALRPAVPYLTLTALVKAGLILYYFMHVAQLWQGEAKHE